LIDSTFKIPEINVFMEIDFRHKISKIILVIYLFIYLLSNLLTYFFGQYQTSYKSILIFKM